MVFPTPTTSDIRYAPHLQCRFDFFAAASTQSGGNVALVFLHGGAWVGGSRTDVLAGGTANGFSLLNYAANSGAIGQKYNIFSIDTRIAIQTTPNKNSYPSYFPEPFEDTGHAIQFIRDNASTFSINPSKVVFFGYSAGATMGLWNCFHRSQPYFSQRFQHTGRFAYRSTSIPNAIMNALGPIDFRYNTVTGTETWDQTNGAFTRFPGLFGTTSSDTPPNPAGTEWGALDPDLKAAASPLAYIEERPLEAQCPVYSVYYNTGAGTVPYINIHASAQAAILHAALDLAEVQNQYEVVTSGDWDDGTLGPALNSRIFAFIESHL